MHCWRNVVALGVLAAAFSMEAHATAAEAVRYGFAAVRVSASRGEDGRGAFITATDPVALDVTAERLGARALDPVLTVGGVQFVHYTFPSRGVMRFVAADAGMLVPGSEVSLKWGRTRVVLQRSLEVPK